MPERTMQKPDDPPPIEAILTDGTSCQLRPEVLDNLLENGRVMQFMRSSGWVTVGVDSVRAKRRNDICLLYYGPERRRASH